MERERRIALWFLSSCLAAALFYGGRVAFHESLPAAFVRPAAAANIVRLKGCVPAPGVFTFPEYTKLMTVINLTYPSAAGKFADKALLAREIHNGDIVTVTQKDGQLFELSVDRMKAREMMLLGIPLDPDLMDLADWDSLPGVGPVLAKSIMEDRHKNGAFGSIDSLQRVPGMGEKKLNALRKYF